MIKTSYTTISVHFSKQVTWPFAFFFYTHTHTHTCTHTRRVIFKQWNHTERSETLIQLSSNASGGVIRGLLHTSEILLRCKATLVANRINTYMTRNCWLKPESATFELPHQPFHSHISNHTLQHLSCSAMLPASKNRIRAVYATWC